jgi:hypothetical protein
MDQSKLIPFELSDLSRDIIEVLLIDEATEPTLIDEIARKNTHRGEILQFLLTHPRTPEHTRQFVAQTLQVPVPQVETEEEIPDFHVEHEEIRRVQGLFQTVQKLKVGEKIHLALRGSREIRSILLRDSSKEVVMTVLENPKITESEIEIIAKQKTTTDEVFRVIGKKREWLRSYPIIHALVTNPKTPISIALQCVPKLRDKDLSALEKNRNVSEAVRAAIKRRLIIKGKT